MKNIVKIFLVLLFSIQAGVTCAADFSFTGNLADDEDVQRFNFSVSAASEVTLRSWSYAGGTNSEGNVISAGGFDTILAVFDSTGALINQNDDGGSNVPPGPVTGRNFDTFLKVSLVPGDYIVTVMQYANHAIGPNISDGFRGSETTGFVDVAGSTRTSFWAFDILNVGNAVVPPPAATIPTLSQWMLILLSLLLFAIGFKSHRQY